MTRSYVFEGDIMPLVRGRVSQGGRVYDDSVHARIKLGNVIDAQHGSDRMFQGNLKLKLFFRLPFPDGTGLKRQEEKNGNYYTTRPTISLFIRTFEDILSGILFTDGSIIVSVEAEKRLSKSPGVEFILTEIE